MTSTSELIGWAAASLTLLAFTSRDVRVLRLASLGASMAFISYGAMTSMWPALALHCVLLPVNLFRLHELLRSGRRPGTDHSATGASSVQEVPVACILRRRFQLLALMSVTLLVLALPVAAAPPTYSERMHQRGLESFRQGRFPDAYGRFVHLANAGHPASARYALWMCEQGPALFGKEWDCAPHELADWRSAAGSAVSPVKEARRLSAATSPRQGDCNGSRQAVASVMKRAIANSRKCRESGS